MNRARGVTSLVIAVTLLGAAVTGCKRRKPHVFERIWLAAEQSCARFADMDGILCWSGGEPPKSEPSLPVAGEIAIDAPLVCAGPAKPSAEASPLVCRPGVWPAGERRVRAVSFGRGHRCAVLDGPGVDLRCDPVDYLGPGAVRHAGTPDAPLAAMAAGELHVCVATRAPKAAVTCFAKGATSPEAPRLEGFAVEQLTVGREHACALLQDGGVRCWGANDRGQLGDGTTTASALPVAVIGIAGVQGIAAGDRHTCARMHDNKVMCWGDNSLQQLADGTTEPRARPGIVVGLLGVAEVVSAANGSCARLGDGEVRCWGSNDRGQLGWATAGATLNVPTRLHYMR